jgi:hypothetical protein
MDQRDIEAILNGIVEALAALEHERWSHWQQYLHSKGLRQPDGSLVLPADLVERWDKQMNTKYENLSDGEKESDREQVQKYLPLVLSAFAARAKHS